MRWWQTALARVGVRTPTGRDAVGAALVALVGVANVLGSAPVDMPWEAAAEPARPLVVAGLGLVVIEGGVLAARRRAPAVVLSVALAAVLLTQALPDSVAGGGLGAAVAAYTVGAHRSRRAALAVLAVAALAMIAWGAVVAQPLAATLRVQVEGPADAVIPPALDLGLGALLLLAVPGLIGAYVQTRRAYTRELVDRTEHLQRQREERARRAVADERTRIARELHDVAAHHVSSIVVQAGAAERVLDRDPETAREALAFIRTQGKETLASMRHLVGVLRVEGEADAAGTEPQPTLARAHQLVDDARADGVEVQLHLDGEPRALPATVDLAAYRVLQEAISNVRRHAPGAPTRARLAYADAHLEVEVSNDAPPQAGTAESTGDGGEADSGHGLVGMRERVALAGGTLDAGARRDGGWRVRALLPTAGRSDEPTAPPPAHPRERNPAEERP